MRDIGERTLKPSDYEEDLEGYTNDDEDNTLPDEPTTSDEGFIARSDEEPETFGSENSLDEPDERAEKVAEEMKQHKKRSSTKSPANAAKSHQKINSSFKAIKSIQTSKSSPKQTDKTLPKKKPKDEYWPLHCSCFLTNPFHQQSTPDSFAEEKERYDREASYADSRGIQCFWSAALITVSLY
jgi:hypothetical protein